MLIRMDLGVVGIELAVREEAMTQKPMLVASAS